jgi:hypothetical protein
VFAGNDNSMIIAWILLLDCVLCLDWPRSVIGGIIAMELLLGTPAGKSPYICGKDDMIIYAILLLYPSGTDGYVLP